ncbi:hypothetical protein [Lichenifustis flavocetrariae]|uniref:Uncharacterized protein n=1 Tax=Lichenifustis flavocetrariae TaxID=2949735 RepID=A0AA42CN82_9HYPH|nr:hypothetical protein [Lichenifustis flavocetrariae]MCW6512466.1 hypothetical protein [Lichenifustis flavocetrariae]
MNVRNSKALAFALASILAAAAPASAGTYNNWGAAREAAVIGGGYAIGEAIGRDAVSGYDGGALDDGAGSRPSRRPCAVRKPVYDSTGAFIGYRGIQLC